MKHCSITFFPEGKTVSVHQGVTLLEAAGQAGIILNSPCGGAGTCGKCRVWVGPDKQEHLACQFQIQTDLEVTIPRESRFFQQQILTHGIEREIQSTPALCKKFLNPVPSSLEILQKTLSRTLSAPVEPHPEAPDNPEMYTLPQGITSVLAFSEGTYRILCLEPGNTENVLYGIAVDVGTTTLVARLTDLHTGRALETVSSANPQIRYGDDVIGRIHHGQNETGLAELQQCIIRQLNDMIVALCRNKQLSPEQVYEITAVGNTTMHHLLLKYPVVQLGQAPYRAYAAAAEDRNARQIGLLIHPHGRLYTVENIAGFIGSDTVAAALAAEMNTAEEVSLLVDIGTNGELVLGTKDRLVSASCAAGPALEGARIRCGSRAVEGAIQRVYAEEGEIDLDVIGFVRPRSICGSGLIDAVAVMLDLDILLPSGAFRDKESLSSRASRSLMDRMIQIENQPAFVLAWDETGKEPAVYLTQRDIREMQLAKAAIQTGILLLLKKLQLEKEHIRHLFLAGAFGNYIRKQSAIRIGLLPAIPQERIQFIGNAASIGAQMILISRHCRQIATDLAGRIEYMEIAGEPHFSAVYSDSLLF